MPQNRLSRLTKLGLACFILGLIGVAFALYSLYTGPRPAETGTLRSFFVAVGVQLVGYALLNRNRFRFMAGHDKGPK